MPPESSREITQLLLSWNAGDRSALDEALNPLASHHSRKSEIVELRISGGLTVEETAEVLKVSPITVHREWNRARAWLCRELGK